MFRTLSSSLSLSLSVIGLSQWAVNLLSLSPSSTHKICINALTYLCMLQQQLKQQKSQRKTSKLLPTGIRSTGHVQALYNLLKCFFISFFNKSHAVAAATWQAAQPKGGQKNNAQPVAPFCLPHAARAVCCQATSRSQPGPEHSLQQDQTLPSQRQVRFSNSRSWLDL